MSTSAIFQSSSYQIALVGSVGPPSRPNPLRKIPKCEIPENERFICTL